MYVHKCITIIAIEKKIMYLRVVNMTWFTGSEYIYINNEFNLIKM